MFKMQDRNALSFWWWFLQKLFLILMKIMKRNWKQNYKNMVYQNLFHQINQLETQYFASSFYLLKLLKHHQHHNLFWKVKLFSDFWKKWKTLRALRTERLKNSNNFKNVQNFKNFNNFRNVQVFQKLQDFKTFQKL